MYTVIGKVLLSIIIVVVLSSIAYYKDKVGVAKFLAMILSMILEIILLLIAFLALLLIWL